MRAYFTEIWNKFDQFCFVADVITMVMVTVGAVGIVDLFMVLDKAASADRCRRCLTRAIAVVRVVILEDFEVFNRTASCSFTVVILVSRITLMPVVVIFGDNE